MVRSKTLLATDTRTWIFLWRRQYLIGVVMIQYTMFMNLNSWFKARLTFVDLLWQDKFSLKHQEFVIVKISNKIRNVRANIQQNSEMWSQPFQCESYCLLATRDLKTIGRLNIRYVPDDYLLEWIRRCCLWESSIQKFIWEPEGLYYGHFSPGWKKVGIA